MPTRYAPVLGSPLALELARLDKTPRPSAVQELGMGAIAPMAAVIVTNPLDVVKVRMQLQGEGGAPTVYRNSWQCFHAITREEGWAALQRGLTGAIAREGFKNSVRVSLFRPIISQLHDFDNGPPPLWARIVAGVTAGSIGSVLVNPFEVVKTRQQSDARATGVVVGTQFGYRGTVDGLVSIVRTNGISGLFQGAPANILRSCIATPVNLVTYSYCMDGANKVGLPSGSLSVFTSAMIACVTSAFMMSPIDVLRTRLYNQPVGPDGKGTMYKGMWDCAVQLVEKEGLYGFFKGFGTSALRQGPQYCLTYLLLENMRWFVRDYNSAHVASDVAHRTFAMLDADKDRFICLSELARAVEQAVTVLSGYKPPGYGKAAMELVSETFHSMDVDQDAVLGFHEYAAAVHQIHHLLWQCEMKAVFMSADKKGLGLVSKDMLWETVKPALVRRDTVIEPDEQMMKVAQANFNSLFEGVDTAGTGYIDFAQFVQVTDKFAHLKHGQVMAAWVANFTLGAD